jgi:hypothetical protein
VQIAEPVERRLAIVRLHAEGWSISARAEQSAVDGLLRAARGL